jgi:hypothetical protein
VAVQAATVVVEVALLEVVVKVEVVVVSPLDQFLTNCYPCRRMIW